MTRDPNLRSHRINCITSMTQLGILKLEWKIDYNIITKLGITKGTFF